MCRCRAQCDHSWDESIFFFEILHGNQGVEGNQYVQWKQLATKSFTTNNWLQKQCTPPGNQGQNCKTHYDCRILSSNPIGPARTYAEISSKRRYDQQLQKPRSGTRQPRLPTRFFLTCTKPCSDFPQQPNHDYIHITCNRKNRHKVAQT